MKMGAGMTEKDEAKSGGVGGTNIALVYFFSLWYYFYRSSSHNIFSPSQEKGKL